MNTPWSILRAITATDSKNEKLAIIKNEAVAGNEEFFKGLRFALDNFDTFGIKKVPERTGPEGEGLDFTTFATFAYLFIARTSTGHAAARQIEQMMAMATNEQWNGWYRLILIKDLKAGFSETTLNKAVAGIKDEYAVPVFACQLARDCVDEEGNVDESELQGIKQIDVKLDGMRVITIVYPNGTVTQTSRNGKELLNFGMVKEQIAQGSNFTEPMVLDGEIMSASFQDLMKQAKRKTNVQADDSVLNLFDIIPLREFVVGVGTVKQRERTALLNAWYEAAAECMPNVTVVGTETVDLDTPAGCARLLEINRAALAGKYEGVMLKDPAAVYECKRGDSWLKMKPFIEESLTVVAVEPGKVGSKFEGTMGALVCEDTVDGKPVKVNVGGGYSIQLRAQIWARHTGRPVTWLKKVKKEWVTMTEQPDGGPIIGLIAEVRADALTKSQDGDTWSMRFPRFKTFRGAVAGEKI